MLLTSHHRQAGLRDSYLRVVAADSGQLTTVLFIAVVCAIIVIITSPEAGDASSVLALKLPSFTLRLSMSSCVVKGKANRK